jgi:signal transduction histidine kinase
MVSDYSTTNEELHAGGSGAATTPAALADHWSRHREVWPLDAAAALIHAQTQFEGEKGALAHVLHADLGGLLVGAVMDIGWLVRQPLMSAAVLDKLTRVSMMLRSAIDLKRTLIEELQPSLLKTVGLFAALRWQVERTCDAAGVAHVQSYPSAELDLDSTFKVTAFRLVQESVEYLAGAGVARSVSISMNVGDGGLACRLNSEHERDTDDRPPSVETVFTTSMHYRASGIGGRFTMTSTQSGRLIEIALPLA